MFSNFYQSSFSIISFILIFFILSFRIQLVHEICFKKCPSTHIRITWNRTKQRLSSLYIYIYIYIYIYKNAIRILKSRSESYDSRYAIRLERFETVNHFANHFATQWFNWFGVSKSSVDTVFFYLYDLLVAWITMEMKSLQLIGLTYNVFNRLCFRRNNISWHDTHILP